MANYQARIGKAGEFRIASELLLRGYNPSIRIVDDGVDLVLDNGKTIQVKTTTNKCYVNSYFVGLSSSKWRKGQQTKERQNLRADYLIIWVVPTGDIYIIPASIVGSKLSVTLTNSKSSNRYYFYANNWDILNEEEK